MEKRRWRDFNTLVLFYCVVDTMFLASKEHDKKIYSKSHLTTRKHFVMRYMGKKAYMKLPTPLRWTSMR